jgi:superfamily II DNA or RNA helicase
MRFTAGDRVTVRGERWVVEEATAYADSTLLCLAKGHPHPEQRCRLLVPFDHPVIADRAPIVRAISARRWARYLRAHLSEQRVHGQLRAGEAAAINILPFQLEPALALIRGQASRFLLADEVGLGKTIQAGLMLAELRSRGWCDRALILTPSGLRQQWADELRHRFSIRPLVIDAASLCTLTASLPFDVNPWTIEPVVITSIDFIKQPEVLRAPASAVWDLLIVDEAHQAAMASLRHEAVQALAARARNVVLLTATPHAGDEHAYRQLCALGQFDVSDRIVLFRRTREQAGLPRTRRAHLLAVQLTPAAREMHHLLDAYLSQLWTIGQDAGRREAQLIALVLAKRAFSSARSLALSLERRMAGLTADIDAPPQPLLPFEGDIDDSDDPVLPVKPAFARIDDERTVLKRLIDSAHRASLDERKMQAIRRILRRVAEPVIVFTEYRDTLEALAAASSPLRKIAMLHGGQTPRERRDAIAAFTNRSADLLIATDAGSEGLNLQSHCRLVVNLELPWNPIRLEQRIGRVDRIGQQRTVHAINLFAAGTAEGDILARLQQKLARIQLSEIELAACVINRTEPALQPATGESHTSTVDTYETAHLEARRMAAGRGYTNKTAEVPDFLVPVTALRRKAAKSIALGCCVVAFVRVRLATPGGRLIEDAFLPVRVPFRTSKRGLRRREVRATAEALLASLHPDLIRIARQQVRARQTSLTHECGEWAARTIDRDRSIARHATSGMTPLVQAGLFDARAVRLRLDEQERAGALQIEASAHANLLEADSVVRLARDPEIALLLITESPGC